MHLNVQLSEPLVPVAEPTVASVPTVSVLPTAPGPTVTLTAGPRTVVVAGDLPPASGRFVAELAAAAGVPLLAEPSSNARGGTTSIATYRLQLGSVLADRVERVVMFGHPTLSRPVTSLLSRAGVELVVVSAYADWPDPGRSAGRVVDGVELAASDPAWLAVWQHQDRAVGRRSPSCWPANRC